MLENVQTELEELMRLRDEMKTRVPFDDAELSERWELMEEKWDAVADEIGEMAQSQPARALDQTRRARALLEEIRDGYLSFGDEAA